MTNLNDVIVWLAHALAGLFFVGVCGCVLVVVISWISIFKSGFSRDDS